MPPDKGLNRRNTTSQIHGSIKKFSANPQIQMPTARIVPICVRILGPNQKPLSSSGRSMRAARRKSHLAMVSADAPAIRARARSNNEGARIVGAFPADVAGGTACPTDPTVWEGGGLGWMGGGVGGCW